ncbi:MAG TPA: Rieske (2Fe-2S) protein [Dokdonella sp.]
MKRKIDSYTLPELPQKDAMPCRLDRRGMLKLTALAFLGVSHVADNAFADEAADKRPQPGDRLVDINGDLGKPLRIDDIKLASKPILAFPFDPATKKARDGSRLNKLLLIKLDATAMNAETKARSAAGVLAFSAICTHQGCDVSEFLPEDKNLLCFCHFSKYDPLADGAVTAGPAPRNLPTLALKEENGELVVAGLLSSAPGAKTNT